MKVVRVAAPGDPEVMVTAEVESPRPGPGHVQIRVEYAGVNFLDVYYRRGDYPLSAPFTPGVEGSGVVETVGAGVTGFEVGQRVAWVRCLGSYAERINVPAEAIVPVPDGVASVDAAASMLQGVTAHFLIHDIHHLQAGDAILVHAAAGGVGSLLVQLAKRRGIWVLGTVSDEAKEPDVRAYGADEVVSYRTHDFEREVLSRTRGRGVRVVYDGVGRDTWRKSLGCLGRRGHLVIYGQASGPVPPIDLDLLKSQGSVSLTRPTVADYIATRDELFARTRDVFAWLADGTLKVRIDATFSIRDAPAAHARLESRRSRGKLLIDLSPSPRG